MPRTPAPVLASPPTVNLAPRDVEALVEELQAYHAIFSPLFRRREQRAGGVAVPPRPVAGPAAQVHRAHGVSDACKLIQE